MAFVAIKVSDRASIIESWINLFGVEFMITLATDYTIVSLIVSAKMIKESDCPR